LFQFLRRTVAGEVKREYKNSVATQERSTTGDSVIKGTYWRLDAVRVDNEGNHVCAWHTKQGSSKLQIISGSDTILREFPQPKPVHSLFVDYNSDILYSMSMSSIVRMDKQGKVLSETTMPINFYEFILHSSGNFILTNNTTVSICDKTGKLLDQINLQNAGPICEDLSTGNFFVGVNPPQDWDLMLSDILLFDMAFNRLRLIELRVVSPCKIAVDCNGTLIISSSALMIVDHADKIVYQRKHKCLGNQISVHKNGWKYCSRCLQND